ncbi:hypothetical protein K438DRAFT_341489 [Mycena galopus ATCC 62051]|nr:hypothetical protein K438DRAFT_341489 [Mycena galopus ATCC 62051]
MCFLAMGDDRWAMTPCGPCDDAHSCFKLHVRERRWKEERIYIVSFLEKEDSEGASGSYSLDCVDRLFVLPPSAAPLSLRSLGLVPIHCLRICLRTTHSALAQAVTDTTSLSANSHSHGTASPSRMPVEPFAFLLFPTMINSTLARGSPRLQETPAIYPIRAPRPVRRCSATPCTSKLSSASGNRVGAPGLPFYRCFDLHGERIIRPRRIPPVYESASWRRRRQGYTSGVRLSLCFFLPFMFSTALISLRPSLNTLAPLTLLLTFAPEVPLPRTHRNSLLRSAPPLALALALAPSQS